MKIATILAFIITFLGGALGYAMDWQLKQDAKISDLDKLILRQTIILEQQIEINEKIEERNMFIPRYRDYSTPRDKEVTK